MVGSDSRRFCERKAHAAAAVAEIDLELQSLVYTEDDDGTGYAVAENEASLSALLDFCVWATSQHSNFDLVQAFIASMLKTHGDLICRHTTLAPKLAALAESQARMRKAVQTLFSGGNCLTSTFANAFA